MSDPKPFVFEPTGEAKRYAPATERNRDAIATVLKGALPSKGRVLEIASGTGEHIVHFARRFQHLEWQPSDPDSAALASIAAWRDEAASANVLPPIYLDASADWPIDHVDAIICINMVHISPWAATLGLFRNAARILPADGMLYLYGPYRRVDIATASTNEQFDQSLKGRNPNWGLRYVEDVAKEASIVGMRLERLIDMPANNLSLIFRPDRSGI